MARQKSPRRTDKSAQNQTSTENAIPAEERYRLIEQAAYFRAQQRGFEGGDPLEDWLAAEREINRSLPNPQQQKQELAAYTSLRDRVRNVLGEARDTLGADTIRQALATAVTQLKQVGEHTADTIDKVAASVEKDMINAAQKVGTQLSTFSEKTADLFQVWRDRSKQFLSGASTALGEWLQQNSEKLKHQTYHSGDMAASGTLECTACGEHLVLRTAAHLPACAKCRHTEFRRL